MSRSSLSNEITDASVPSTSSSLFASTSSSAASSPLSTVATNTGLGVKANQSVTSAKLAKAAALAVPKGAKVALTVSSKYKKVCKVVGATVKAIGKGMCVIKVVVATKLKTTSKTVTVKVT